MACHLCGNERTEFSLSKKSETGGQQVLAYCEPCFVAEFGRDPQVGEILAQRRVAQDRHFQRKLQQDMERLKAGLAPHYENLRAQNPRFAREAYELVFIGLAWATKREGAPYQSGQCGRHVTAAEIVTACQRYARCTWGREAKATLAAWGIETASDIGDIVYLLIENRMMGTRKGDSRADFNGLPFLT
jgi:uncharacterized repeat protein (TIGR04138 family)